jgi:hypothetical protein
MAYLQPSDADPIPVNLITALARALDLVVPDEDLDALSTALRDQLASVGSIESLHPEDVSPPTPFDPRWHD